MIDTNSVSVVSPPVNSPDVVLVSARSSSVLVIVVIDVLLDFLLTTYTKVSAVMVTVVCLAEPVGEPRRFPGFGWQLTAQPVEFTSSAASFAASVSTRSGRPEIYPWLTRSWNCGCYSKR